MNNLAKLVGIGAGVTAAAFLIKNSVEVYKESYEKVSKTTKELKKQSKKRDYVSEDEEDTDINNNQVSDEENELDIDYEINLPESLFNVGRFSSNNLPIDAVDTNKILSSDKSHVVHVTQSFDRKNNRNILNFLFEIPKSAYFDKKVDCGIRKFIDGNTNISSFIRGIKGVWNKEEGLLEKPGFQETMLDIVKDPRYLNLKMSIKDGHYYHSSKTEPYAFISYQERDEEGCWIDKTRLIVLDRNIYENNPYNSEHNKATEFIQDLYIEYEKENSLNLVVEDNNPNYKNIEILDAFMAVRVSFNIQDAYNLDGINSISGLKILEKIYGDLEIEGYNKGIFEYDNFLFYTDDLDDVSVYIENEGYIKKKKLYE